MAHFFYGFAVPILAIIVFVLFKISATLAEILKSINQIKLDVEKQEEK